MKRHKLLQIAARFLLQEVGNTPRQVILKTADAQDVADLAVNRLGQAAELSRMNDAMRDAPDENLTAILNASCGLLALELGAEPALVPIEEVVDIAFTQSRWNGHFQRAPAGLDPERDPGRAAVPANGERARTTGIMGVEMRQLRLEFRIRLCLFPLRLQVEDQRHQRLGDEAATEDAETAVFVGTFTEGIGLG